MARVGGNSRILCYLQVLEPSSLLCASCFGNRKMSFTALFSARISAHGLLGVTKGKLWLFLIGGKIGGHV